ncbi:P-loop containing nucleoside triphosphate hydrolase protein [Chaetomium tenue]|uniref:P-loop containing nucleoside triphosphate hydrolase protein n=1 Tax=Chaetomium tenue TaxID=1854479 RepID=A0ACB7PDH9_9PEZI|nr:P-loop containing nucleoside triphosphate hydrolase protein [Chaetomium globosum]
MSAQLRAVGAMAPLPRRLAVRAVRHFHQLPTGGIQRADLAARSFRRSLQFPSNAYHNAVIVRNASFARMLPKLALKFVRIPALFGGVMIGTVGWVQYQAIQVSNSAQEMYSNMKNTVTSTASTLWGGAKDIAGQTKQGWDNTKENFEIPEWLDKIMKGEGDAASSKGGPGGQGGPEPPKQSRSGVAAVAGASAAAYGLDQSDENDERTPEEVIKDDQMMFITKKMIEIRNLLQKVGQSNTVTLPSIVVIGSQSSGKSSVLEAIVGHEFLPKGSNMITRRPIELTLVNDPEARVDYGEFPDLGLTRVTDFSLIQKTLTELNQSVPESLCVSDDPIRLTIHSPGIPDLSLIDLPGYIQVAGENQPRELKRKISELCDKYIRGPNIILAISAADTDLANSTALQASRRVDPRGERTIGVITKMDLVEPDKGADILSDRKYPLRLGYVGVISKLPTQTGLFRRETGNLLAGITRNERSFFNTYPAQFGPEAGVNTGTITLRKKLMQVLEQTMSSKLHETTESIQRELEETTYQFKVQYNEQPMSAEAYLAASLDEFKHQFHAFSSSFGRAQLQSLLKDALDQKVLDQLAARYWNRPVEDLSVALPEPDNIADLPTADPKSPYWHRQLDTALSGLTRLGVGRLAATVAATAVQSNIDKLLDKSSFSKHPSARKAISEAASTVLADRSYATSDGIEISLKPYKFDPDIQPNEWAQGREHVVGVLQGELEQCQSALKSLESAVGGRKKLKEVMTFVDKARRGEVIVEGDHHPSGAGGFSAALLARGREAAFLRDRADIINMRITAAKSRKCKDPENKYYCPEVFLDAVATKLSQTAVLFLNVEMLNDFYSRFPREVESKLHEHMAAGGLERFAREDPKVRRHLDLIHRKELLELVLTKIEDLNRFGGGAGSGRGAAGGRELAEAGKKRRRFF